MQDHSHDHSPDPRQDQEQGQPEHQQFAHVAKNIIALLSGQALDKKAHAMLFPFNGGRLGADWIQSVECLCAAYRVQTQSMNGVGKLFDVVKEAAELELERKATKVLMDCRQLTTFCAAMGSATFYTRSGPVSLGDYGDSPLSSATVRRIQEFERQVIDPYYAMFGGTYGPIKLCKKYNNGMPSIVRYTNW